MQQYLQEMVDPFLDEFCIYSKYYQIFKELGI